MSKPALSESFAAPQARREAAPGRSVFGWWTLFCLVVANMIGAGVFTTSGFTLESLGQPRWVMIAWGVAGAIAVCGALSYGALVERIPDAGGEYLFLSRTLGPLWGFLAGWVSLIAGFTGATALSATTLERYAFPENSRPNWLPPDVLACAAIVLAGLAHGFRVGVGSRIQNLIVALKLAVIGLFLWHVLSQWNENIWRGVGSGDNVFDPPDFWLLFATSVMWITLSYSGFNAAVYVASETESARRSVPSALLVGTLFVFALYLCLNFAFIYAPPYHVIAGKSEVAAIAADYISGKFLANVVRMVIILAQLTSIAAMIMIGPRVYAKMADDGLLPNWLRFRSEAPRGAIALQVVLAVAMVLFSTLLDLINYLSVTLSLSAAATVSCLFVRRGEVGAARPWVLIPAALYVACTVGLAGLMTWHKPWNLAGTAVTLLTGVAAFAVFRLIGNVTRQPPHG
jgi:APA family basic amino acid/polyamine antiporter